MTESSTEETPVSAAQIAVADTWADFTKALAIYPEKHDRVRQMAESFFAALNEALEDIDHPEFEGIDVIFYEGGLLVRGQRIDPDPGSNRAWLRERIHNSTLAGVEFLEGLRGIELTAFTKRLLELFSRTDMDLQFEDLWPDAFAGLRLIPRQFEGTFTGDETDIEMIQRSWGGRGALRLDLQQEQDLAELLAGSEAICARVEEIQGALEASKPDSDEPKSGHRRMDLVGRIVKLMPAEALRDFRRVIEVTTGMLDSLLERLESRPHHQSQESLFDNVLLERLMFITSRIAFGRKGPSASELAAKVKEEGDEGGEDEEAEGQDDDENPEKPAARSRHASDDAITDDLGEFLEELAKFRVPDEGRDFLDDLEVPSEQLGVYLHYLVHLKDARVGPKLHPVLARLLRTPGDDELEVLAQYLQWRRSSRASAEGYPERLVDFLRTANLTHLRRECDVVSIATIRAQFPTDFGLYLELMDFENERDVAELEALCSNLGPKRLREAGAELESLAPETVKGLLSGASKTWMPFAWMFLEQAGEQYRATVIDYLKRLQLSSSEACLLTISQDSHSLPIDYLQALLVPPTGKESVSRLRHQISSVICAFVRSTAEQPEFESRRVYAIKYLTKFATQEARKLLKDLVSGSNYVLIKKEPKAIRRAAKEVLTRLTGSKRGGARV